MKKSIGEKLGSSTERISKERIAETKMTCYQGIFFF